MPSALLSRVKKIERNPEVVKAAERQRKLETWQEMIAHYDSYLKRCLAIEQYMGINLSPGVIADDFIEFEITVTWKMLAVHPIEVGQYFPVEIEGPARKEVHQELMLRWYGVRRTPEEEAETDRMCKQAISDFDAGLPREQSEGACYFKQWYEQHPRRNYIYKNLPVFKPEGWEWQL